MYVMERRSLSKKMDRIVFLDFETTGLNPFSNEIIEIAIKDNIGNKWQSLIKPTFKLPQKIVDITKITDNMIEKNSISQYDGLMKIIEFIDGKNLNCTVAKWVIGHNLIGFDWAFFVNSCKKYKIILPSYVNLLDTYRMAQYIYKDKEYISYKLCNLCEMNNIKIDGYHRAMNDVIATEKLFNELIQKFENLAYNKIWFITTQPFQ